MTDEGEVTEVWEDPSGDVTAGEVLAQRVDRDPPDVSEYRGTSGVGDLEVAIFNLVRAAGGEIRDEKLTDAAADAHLRAGRIHFQLRRSAVSFVQNAAAGGVTFFLLGDFGLGPAIGFLKTLINSVTWMSPEEMAAVELVIVNMRCGAPTTRDDLVPFNIDVQKLIKRGVLVEKGRNLTVSM
ncbi:hypothetical protein [Mycobacterium sp. Aquia_213]|uniref:hypothetical protein n=1 Tax=Mycobacterium sp. Aquia_213 TaxID=2991728 RepID=UPI00226EB911|nr:hypothetical protein [Mycobacterium sp. Aquia_213]WAC89374.1 hypothetical protein LMQ14_15395 [Mycobacterium sp. Aquia_213]